MRKEVRQIIIGIPFYKNAHLVAPIADSLIACAAELQDLGVEIILYNDSPEFPPLGDALDIAAQSLGKFAPTRVAMNAETIGFVRTMNQLISEGVERRIDVLLLNSDTVIFPGALREMMEVADSDPMIGFVNPRSNNATLATLPFQARFRDLDPEPAYAAWKDVAARLPRVSYIPTAVGFCMLCRWKVLAEFGGFDEIYGKGYNEENDLVMRANRCGYRAVLANKAFVWHQGEASFASLDKNRRHHEAKNRAILLQRYPKYEKLTNYYFDSPEHRAEMLLGMLIPDENGQIEIAFDFSSFGDYHNGTFMAGRQLLSAAVEEWPSRFKIVVICSENAFSFHNYAALGVERHDPHGKDCYAAIFVLGQPYEFDVLKRSAERGAVVGFYMFDTISIDIGSLYSPALKNIWQFALEHADIVATTSELTTEQFDRRFHIPDHVVRVRSMHSLELKDYRSSLPAASSSIAEDGSPFSLAQSGPYLLVIGNAFPHKYVVETTNALAAAYPDLAIIAMGASRGEDDVTAAEILGLDASKGFAPPRLSCSPNVFIQPTGHLTDLEMERLYRDARAVVFPTHYEGFGFPLLNALAVETPVLVRRNMALEEVWRLQGCNPNVHFFDLTTELLEIVADLPPWVATREEAPPGGGAARSANEILHGLEQALANADYRRIVARIRGIQFAQESVSAETRTNTETLARKLAVVQRELEKRSDALATVKRLQDALAAHERSMSGRILKFARRQFARLRVVSAFAGPSSSPRLARSDETIILSSGLFDPIWYLETYGDVFEAQVDPLAHFTTQALKERRDPGPNFSTKSYIEQNPDVLELGLNPVIHYLQYGRAKEQLNTPQV